MSRPVDAAIAAELTAKVVIPVWFVKLDFDAGAVYAHTDLGEIPTTSPSATWSGVGDLGSIGELEETSELVSPQLKLSISAVDTTLLDEALDNEYWERGCDVYLGFRDTVTGDMVSDPHGPFSYFISEMHVSPVAIDLIVEHEMAAWDRAANDHYTMANHQRAFAGDTFFEFVPRMRDLVLRVGEKNQPIIAGGNDDHNQWRNPGLRSW